MNLFTHLSQLLCKGVRLACSQSLLQETETLVERQGKQSDSRRARQLWRESLRSCGDDDTSCRDVAYKALQTDSSVLGRSEISFKPATYGLAKIKTAARSHFM